MTRLSKRYVSPQGRFEFSSGIVATATGRLGSSALARRPATARKSPEKDELTRAVPSRLSVQENRCVSARTVAANRLRNMLIAAVETGQHESEAGSRRRRAAAGGLPNPISVDRGHIRRWRLRRRARRARDPHHGGDPKVGRRAVLRLARPQSAAGSRFRGRPSHPPRPSSTPALLCFSCECSGWRRERSTTWPRQNRNRPAPRSLHQTGATSNVAWVVQPPAWIYGDLEKEGEIRRWRSCHPRARGLPILER